MNPTISFLSEQQIPKIHMAHIDAFSDYQIDMSYMTKERMKYRAIKNGIDYESSVGVLVNGEIVGFTLIGIDNWQGNKAAFDCGTGIIPEYRGQGLAGKMFDFAIPKLKKAGITKFLLEVLQDNNAAIKAYEKAGFKITREFDCFDLHIKDAKLPLYAPYHYSVKELNKNELLALKDYADWQPSWENNFSSINRIEDDIKIYGAFLKDHCIGFLAYYPLLEWILNIAIQKKHRNRGVASLLLNCLLKDLPKNISVVGCNNIDAGDTAFIEFLKNRGFESVVMQYEMEYDLGVF